MPTPEAWRENLERISRIGSGIHDDSDLKREDADTLEQSLESLDEGCDQLADNLLALLAVIPEDAKHLVISGYFKGVVLSVLKIVADADRK